MERNVLQLEKFELRLALPSDIPFQKFSNLFGEVNSIYKILTVAFLTPQVSDDEKMLSGCVHPEYTLIINFIYHDEFTNEFAFVLQGLSQSIKELRKLIKEIRDWKAEAEITRQKAQQESEKTEQERQRTLSAKINNVKKALQLPVSEEIKDKICRNIADHAIELESNPIGLREINR